ncbi:hypothetical protein BY996DRAFT_6510920 [Phakopsora pachyrhizi]|nr:hypothetical protein BY996DRAFT_6510920 [Phakopsora pachyrhizi]
MEKELSRRIILNKKNYVAWAMSMRSEESNLGCLKYVKGNDLEVTEEKKEKYYYLIMPHIDKKTKLWNLLKEKFIRSNIQARGAALDQFLQLKLKNVDQWINDLRESTRKMQLAGTSIDNDLVSRYVIQSLPSKYKSFPITRMLWSSVNKIGGENHMSEEDKEREADWFCSLFERKNWNRIIKAKDPRQKAADTGLFEETEMILERFLAVKGSGGIYEIEGLIHLLDNLGMFQDFVDDESLNHKQFELVKAMKITKRTCQKEVLGDWGYLKLSTEQVKNWDYPCRVGVWPKMVGDEDKRTEEQRIEDREDIGLQEKESEK